VLGTGVDTSYMKYSSWWNSLSRYIWNDFNHNRLDLPLYR
jgi:hypothetical protein